ESGDRTRMLVRVTALRDGDAWLPASGRSLLLVNGHLLGVSVGDRLRIACQLSAPAGPRNPGEFDFARHARGRRQLSLLSADFPQCVTVTARRARWSIGQWFENLRTSGDEALWRRLAHERSGLAAALLLGAREQLDQETTDAFARTGTVHLLSISGLHVAILAGALFWTMRLGFVPRGTALAGVAMLVLIYALVIAAEPPAVRATILVLLVAASLYWGRRLLPFNALAAAALVVLAANPADLFRVGPQLSFMAVASLIWFGPRLARRASGASQDPLERLIAASRPWPERSARWLCGWCWRATLLTAAVWGTSAPLVMAHFHLFSPATLLLTPLLAVPIAVGLMSGFAVLVLDWVAPPLGAVAGWVCDMCLWFLNLVVDLASRCPGSHVWVPGPDGWWLAVFYGVLATWMAVPALRPPPRWCLALLAAWTTVGLAVPLARKLEAPRLACTFLSVGHGCAVVIELPDGRTMLYDCGRLGSPTAGARSVSGFLWSRGIMRLDAVVISHADIDHYNALPELLDEIAVGRVYVSPVMFNNPDAATARLLEAIEGASTPLASIRANDRLHVGGDCRIEVWHPLAGGVQGSDNANSLVVAIEYQGRRILLTGDIESPGMEDVLAETPQVCEVLLAPHHGSIRSSPRGFSDWSSPRWVIISGGPGRDHHQVRQVYEQAGATVLDTETHGAISVRIENGEATVETLRGGDDSLRRGRIRSGQPRKR
ncbi:MAG: ComEC/Rec2 family competence protein, partial [Pirellulales bacterium]